MSAPVKLPALPAVTSSDVSLSRWLMAATERMEVREGTRGNPDEKTLLVRDLQTFGLDEIGAAMKTGGQGVFQRQPDGSVRFLDPQALAEAIRSTQIGQSSQGSSTGTMDIIPERVRQLVLQGVSDEESARKSDIAALDRKLRSISLTVASGVALPIYINVKDAPYSAVGDGVVDDTAAIQAAINAGQVAGVGGVVYLPAGRYKVTANLNIKWPNMTGVYAAGKVMLRGAGSGLTMIEDWRVSAVAGAVGGCINYDFSSFTGAGIDNHYMFSWVGGFSLVKMVDFTVYGGAAYPTIGIGAGLYVNKAPLGLYQDITAYGYGTAVKLVDCLGFTVKDMYLSFCDFGVDAQQSSFSEPTASTFTNITIAGARSWGLKIRGGGPVMVNGGVFQSLGKMATVSGAIYFENSLTASLGLPKGITVDSAYFEQNVGSADIYLDTPTATAANIANSVTNCMFARNSNILFTTNNILVNAVGTTTMELLLENNGFIGYAPYVASSSRKYVGFAGTLDNIKPVYISNRFTSSVEDPTGLSVAATFPSIGFGVGTAYITAAGNNVSMNGTVAVAPAVGIAPEGTTGTIFNGGSTARWANVFSVLGNFSGNVTFGASAYIRGDGTNLNFLDVVSVAPGVGFAPNANNTYFNGGSTVRWANTFSVLGNFSGAVTFGSSAYITSAGSNLDLLGVLTVVPAAGVSPSGNGTLLSGGPSNRWSNVYSVLGNFSGTLTAGSNITWGSYSIPVPTGVTSSFLRADGVWTAPPAGGSGTVTNVATGTGLTGGPITTTGTIALNATVAVVNGVGFAPGIDNAYVLGGGTLRWTTVFATNATINTSDARQKTAIVDSDLGLSFINALRPVSYKWTVGQNLTDPENPQNIIGTRPGKRTFYGLIAQEVKTTLDKAGILDFAGWTLDDKDDPDSQQGLRYTEFIAPLIKAVQELTARIETLEAR